jgi:hypothetical protein
MAFLAVNPFLPFLGRRSHGKRPIAIIGNRPHQGWRNDPKKMLGFDMNILCIRPSVSERTVTIAALFWS